MIAQDKNTIKSYDTAQAGYYNEEGVSFHELGQYVRAIKAFDKAIEIDPEFKDAYYHRMRSCNKIKAFDEAIASDLSDQGTFDDNDEVPGILGELVEI